MAAPQIITVYPAPSASGIAIGDQVKITFDQEIDRDTINTGTLVLIGPDEAPVVGPVDVTPQDVPGFDDEDILSSPYFDAYVPGVISFLRVDDNGDTIDDSIEDTAGDGTLWRTMAIFTPSKPLSPNSTYKCMLLGDELPSDNFDTGIKTRTVFDTVFTGTGTGRLEFNGGYTGTVERNYVVEITVDGPPGTAEYIWWEENDPLTVAEGVTSTGERELQDGVYVTCDPDGSFVAGDKFEVVVKPATTLANNYSWIFTTGSGSIVTPPSDTPTSGIESVLTNVSGETTIASFYVSEIVPEDGKYGIAITETDIVITFSAAIDETTLAGNITVKSEVANGDDNQFSATGDLAFSTSVVSNVLTIQLDTDQLYENNIVIIELDKSIADTEGNTLEEDYEAYFSTPYTPLYTSLRRLRLDLGSLIYNIPEETIMFAIWEASLQTDINSFVTSDISNTVYYNAAKREYATCMAGLTLVKALLGDRGLADRMSKTLGDLTVSRGGTSAALKTMLMQLEDCAARWEVVVQTGGDISNSASLRSQYAVKGSLADDALTVNRQWEPTSGIGTIESAIGAANDDTYASARKNYRTFRRRRRIYGED